MIFSPLGNSSSMAPVFNRVRRTFSEFSKFSASQRSLSASPMRPGLRPSFCNAIASSSSSFTILMSGSPALVLGLRLKDEFGHRVVGQPALSPILSDLLHQRRVRYGIEAGIVAALIGMAPPGETWHDKNVVGLPI